MMRQIGKQILTLAALLLLALPVRAGGLVTAIVTDPISGVAIEGYDPVSYFISSGPVMGKPDFEYYWRGLPWYFANAANRDIFMRAPEAYAPQYGGHCLMSLSRGYLSDGKPRLYVIEGLKLYFFYSAANRDAFLLSRAEAIASADQEWPVLSKDLSGIGSEIGAAESVSEVAEAAPVAPAAPDASLAHQ